MKFALNLKMGETIVLYNHNFFYESLVSTFLLAERQQTTSPPSSLLTLATSNYQFVW